MTRIHRCALLAILGMGLLALSACHQYDDMMAVQTQASDPQVAAEFDAHFPTMEQLRERLQLRPEQEEPFAAAIERMKTKIHERREARANGEAMPSKRGMRHFHGELREILDDAQLKEFHGAMKELHRELGGHDPVAMRLRHLDHLTEVLALSPEQRERFASVLDQQRESRRSLRESGERPDEATMREHHEAMRAELSTFLSAEQLSKLESLWREKRHARGSRVHGDH